MAQCEACGAPLVEAWEIYGEVNEQLCFDCWDDMRNEAQGYDEVYGLGPHHHDLSRTGSIIGSTVFDPLPGEPDAEGWIKITDKVYYLPDYEDPHLGTWRYYR